MRATSSFGASPTRKTRLVCLNGRFVGLAALRQESIDQKKPFDYDRPIEGIRALDRYTVQFKVQEPRPRFVENLTASDLLGAVAREVVEYYGDQVDAHPVGTGPFRLAQWRRSSFIALERNPDYRELLYDAEPAPDDAEGQALLARFKGRRLPMIDRVEISIIEEEQPRWLAFVNGEADVAYRVGYQYVTLAMPNGKVAPNLAKKGIRGFRIVEPSSNFLFFNMEDPTVGGYGPDRIALRRGIALAMAASRDQPRLQRPGHGGQFADAARRASTPGSRRHERLRPGQGKRCWTCSLCRPRRRRLARHARLARRWFCARTPVGSRNRKINEVMKKNMDAIGIRTTFNVAQWPENLKAARAGKLPMWSLGGAAAAPDGQGSLARYHSRQIGGQNMARFRLPAFDALYERMQVLPDGPERAALFDQAKKLAVAYMPYKFKLNRISVDMAQAWVIGYRRPVFWQEWWHYVDIDDTQRPKT